MPPPHTVYLGMRGVEAGSIMRGKFTFTAIRNNETDSESVR